MKQTTRFLPPILSVLATTAVSSFAAKSGDVPSVARIPIVPTVSFVTSARARSPHLAITVRRMHSTVAGTNTVRNAAWISTAMYLVKTLFVPTDIV
jgi:hypothetical protein